MYIYICIYIYIYIFINYICLDVSTCRSGKINEPKLTMDSGILIFRSLLQKSSSQILKFLILLLVLVYDAFPLIFIILSELPKPTNSPYICLEVWVIVRV